MGFKDVMIMREYKSDIDSPYKKVAVFLHTDKAYEKFKEEFDYHLDFNELDIPLEKWFICSYNQIFEKPLIENITLLDEFIEDTTFLLIENAKELDWAKNIK